MKYQLCKALASLTLHQLAFVTLSHEAAGMFDKLRTKERFHTQE